MQFNKLGKTNLNISKIGLGTWGMGGMWGPRDDRGAIETIKFAMDSGINFIDTAAVYGHGHSESLIASAFKEAKKKVHVATKIPPKNFEWPAKHNIPLSETFPKKHVLELTEFSLKNLRLDCIDLQQLHVWSDSWVDEIDDLLEAIHSLKQQGKIKYFGISINDHEPNSALKMVKSGLIDSVQVIYNIFDQSPEDKLFPLCLKHNVGVIVRVPFDEGALTEKLTPNTTFHKKDWRSRYFTPERLTQTCKRIENLTKMSKNLSLTLPELALKFCLTHQAVTTVIPGMRTKKHVATNLNILNLPTLSNETLLTLKKHAWEKNFYNKT